MSVSTVCPHLFQKGPVCAHVLKIYKICEYIYIFIYIHKQSQLGLLCIDLYICVYV